MVGQATGKQQAPSTQSHQISLKLNLLMTTLDLKPPVRKYGLHDLEMLTQDGDEQ